MTREYFDLLNEGGNKTGEIKPREEVHRDGDWHRVAHVWVVNKRGEILLQRRCATKDSYPNMLDVSCGGHLVAGDDSLTGAIRELKEELNLDVKPEDLHLMKSLKHHARRTDPGFINNEFQDIYILETDKTVDDMKFQEDEISEIFFVPREKFQEMIESKQPDLIMHDEAFAILFDYIDRAGYGR